MTIDPMEHLPDEFRCTPECGSGDMFYRVLAGVPVGERVGLWIPSREADRAVAQPPQGLHLIDNRHHSWFHIEIGSPLRSLFRTTKELWIRIVGAEDPLLRKVTELPPRRLLPSR